MRQERIIQSSIFDLFATHEIGDELKAMSQWLGEHRDLLGLGARDLRRPDRKATDLGDRQIIVNALNYCVMVGN